MKDLYEIYQGKRKRQINRNESKIRSKKKDDDKKKKRNVMQQTYKKMTYLF